MSMMPAGLRDWLRSFRSRSQLSNLGHDELNRIADEIGVSVGELRSLDRLGPDAAAQLPRRMAALHLDPTAVAERHPTVFRDLQRLCSRCRSKGRCERDLSRNPSDPIWQSYCPNAMTLRALLAAREPRG